MDDKPVSNVILKDMTVIRPLAEGISSHQYYAYSRMFENEFSKFAVQLPRCVLRIGIRDRAGQGNMPRVEEVLGRTDV